jgi:outer membrane protein TolC
MNHYIHYFPIIFIALGMTAQSFAMDINLDLMRAVYLTLDHNTDILLQKQKAIQAQGNLNAVSGQFELILKGSATSSHEKNDLTQSEQLQYSEHVSTVKTNEISYQIRLEKQCRWGMLVSTGVEMSHFHEKYNQSIDTPPGNRGTISFKIYQPLMRGFGTITTADEIFARLMYESENFQIQHMASQSILNTARAYWFCLASQKRFIAFSDSEKRAKKLITEINALIKADELPPSEILQLQANAADKTGNKIKANQALREAWLELGLNIGLQFDVMESNRTITTDFLPLTDNKIFSAYDQLSQEALSHILERRSDYKAVQKKMDAAQIQLKKAQNNLKPKLDLQLELGYSGVDDGSSINHYFSAYSRHIEGPSINLMLSGEFPLNNSSHMGKLTAQTAIYHQRKIEHDELYRRILTKITLSMTSLKSSAAALKQSIESVKFHIKTVENEKKKFKMGMSTLFDLISLEDQLTQAKLNAIDAQLNYSLAVLDVRFQTGLMIRFDPVHQVFHVNNLKCLPDVETRQFLIHNF